jgi:hypothetical protein
VAERGLISLSCFASNRVLDERKGTPLKQDTTISVNYRPRVERKASPDMIKAVYGEKLSLYCNFEANPMRGSQVTWYMNGKVIDFSNGVSKKYEKGNDDGSVLVVKNVDKSIEALYSCSARNEVGSSGLVDVATVYVETKPIVRLSVDPPEPVSELSNANVTLMCYAESENGEITAADRDDIIQI